MKQKKLFNMKLSLIIVIASLFVCCSVRQSSRLRFSEKCGIEIPKDVIVIKDEYQNMLQDFVIEYEIEFSDNSINKILKSIKNSEYFNTNIANDSYKTSDKLLNNNQSDAIWFQSNSGYKYENYGDNQNCFAFIDTVKMTGVFKLSSD